MHESWQYSGPSIRRLRPFLFMFRENVFPDLLKFTTYPVNVAQKRAYDQLHRVMTSPRLRSAIPTSLPYYWTEVIALLDRCTAVAYTGSMKVVPKMLGTMFWFGLAVHAGMMPCFNPAIIHVPDQDEDDQLLKVIASTWPLEHNTSRPLQASTRTHEVEYKERYVEVRRFPLDFPFFLSPLSIKSGDYHMTPDDNLMTMNEFIIITCLAM